MRLKLFAAVAVFILSAVSAQAQTIQETHHGYDARWRAQLRPWHGHYYHIGWGGPVALVVPPTAEMTSDYSWGVAGTRVTRIDHQFQRPYPGGYYWTGYGFAPTPRWPSDTAQFGVYYVRGPW
jgi:hypothetical protein